MVGTLGAMNTNRPAIRYALAGAVLLAGVAWSLSWAFNAQASVGDLRSALGLDQAQWRATLNPALVLVLAALVVWLTRDPRPAKALLVAGAAMLLVGNVLGTGWSARRRPPTAPARPSSSLARSRSSRPAAGSSAMADTGLTGRRWVGIGSGIGSTLAVATAAAAPAAASLGLVLLIDALLQGDPVPTRPTARSAPTIALRGMAT